MARPSRARVVHVELPDEAFHNHPWNPGEIAGELRALWLVEQVRQRRLGAAKAAELADMPRAAFLRLMGRYAVTPFDYALGELEDELAEIR
jgi:predicted HTH domain antitoxin